MQYWYLGDKNKLLGHAGSKEGAAVWASSLPGTAVDLVAVVLDGSCQRSRILSKCIVSQMGGE